MNTHVCKIHTKETPDADVSKLPRVRVAVEADIPQLLQLGIDLHKENGILGLAHDIIKDETYRAIEGRNAIIGVIGDIGYIEAMIMLSMERFWYTRDRHLQEIFSYVSPEHRKSRNARALIEFSKRLAKMLDVPLLIGLLSTDRTQQKIKLYERALGRQSGAYFLFNAKTGCE